jgi:ADP-ribose pyrophosphatase YjhB (NUDIX family)
MSDPRLAVLEQTVAYDGHFKIFRYRLRHRLFAGGMSPELIREVFERGHAVAVLPFDPERGQVVLVEQFRVGGVGVLDDPWLVEPVAGIIEHGEDAHQVARREATEEAGLELLDLVPACTYFASPAAAPRPARYSSAGSRRQVPAGSLAAPKRARTSGCTSFRSQRRSNGYATAASMQSRPSWPCSGWPCIGPGWNSAGGAVARPNERAPYR